MGRVIHLPRIDTGSMQPDEFVSTFHPAADSVTDIDEQTYYPKAKTVTLWQRLMRRVRAWQIKRMKP